MSLLEIHFLHTVGCLLVTFSVFCSIVVLAETVRIREFSAVEFRMLATRTLVLFAAGSYFFRRLLVFPTVLCFHSRFNS